MTKHRSMTKEKKRSPLEITHTETVRRLLAEHQKKARGRGGYPEQSERRKGKLQKRSWQPPPPRATRVQSIPRKGFKHAFRGRD